MDAGRRHGIGASRDRRAGGPSTSAAAQCQKCLRKGHWTYECKNEPMYVQRASRTQQLKNPKLRQPFNEDRPPDMDDPEQQRHGEVKEKMKRKKLKEASKGSVSKGGRRKRRASVSSDSSSSSSSSSSGTSSSDSSDDESDSSSSSSSSSSGSSVDSGSESDVSSRRKVRSKRRRKH